MQRYTTPFANSSGQQAWRQQLLYLAAQRDALPAQVRNAQDIQQDYPGLSAWKWYVWKNGHDRKSQTEHCLTPANPDHPGPTWARYRYVTGATYEVSWSGGDMSINNYVCILGRNTRDGSPYHLFTLHMWLTYKASAGSVQFVRTLMPAFPPYFVVFYRPVVGSWCSESTYATKES